MWLQGLPVLRGEQVKPLLLQLPVPGLQRRAVQAESHATTQRPQAGNFQLQGQLGTCSTGKLLPQFRCIGQVVKKRQVRSYKVALRWKMRLAQLVEVLKGSLVEVKRKDEGNQEPVIDRILKELPGRISAACCMGNPIRFLKLYRVEKLMLREEVFFQCFHCLVLHCLGQGFHRVPLVVLPAKGKAAAFKTIGNKLVLLLVKYHTVGHAAGTLRNLGSEKFFHMG